MAIKADVLAQLTLKETDDRRRRTWTVSDQTVNESAWHYFDLASSGGTYIIPMGGVGSDTGAKLLWIETDQEINLRLDDKTTSDNQFPIQANGFLFAYVTGVIAPYVINDGFTDATVQVAIVEL